MSDLQNISGQNGTSNMPPPVDGGVDDNLENDVDGTLSGAEDPTSEENGLSVDGLQPKEDVTPAQIAKFKDDFKTLQVKFSAQNATVDHSDIDKIISDLSKVDHDVNFTDDEHKAKLSQEFDEALQIYNKASKIVTDQEAAATQVSGTPSDAPDSVEGDKAIYNTDKNPSPNINVFSDPKIKNFDITATGTPTINASSLDDKVEMRTNQPSKDKITAMVTQVDKEGKVTTKTLVMDTSVVKDKIKFVGFNPKNVKVNGKIYGEGMVKNLSVVGASKDQSILNDAQRIQKVIQGLDGGDTGSRASTILWQMVRSPKSAVKAIKDLKKEDGNDAINLLMNAIRINYAVSEDTNLNIPQASIQDLNSGFLGAATSGYNTGMAAAQFGWDTAMGHVSGGIFNFKSGDIGTAYDADAGIQGAKDFLGKIATPEVMTALMDKTTEETSGMNRPDGIQDSYTLDDGSFMNSGKVISADTLGLSRTTADTFNFLSTITPTAAEESPLSATTDSSDSETVNSDSTADKSTDKPSDAPEKKTDS